MIQGHDLKDFAVFVDGAIAGQYHKSAPCTVTLFRLDGSIEVLGYYPGDNLPQRVAAFGPHLRKV